MTGSAGSLAAHHGAVWQRQFGRLLGGQCYSASPPTLPGPTLFVSVVCRAAYQWGQHSPPPKFTAKREGGSADQLGSGFFGLGGVGIWPEGKPTTWHLLQGGVEVSFDTLPHFTPPPTFHTHTLLLFPEG